MVENISNLIILVISIFCGKDIFVDFLKMCYENIKHSEDYEYFENQTILPNGKRYNVYNFKTRLYIGIEGLAIFLYLSAFILIIENFCGLSKFWASSDILIDKILSIICPFSIVSFVDSFKNKIYKQTISIDDILNMTNEPESIKKYLIQKNRFLTLEEIEELDKHFYHDRTIDWTRKNGFIEVNISLRKADAETEEN